MASASRDGGRLDAVFVDEGFGWRDINVLNVALATLGKVAGDGKMVALITHLRLVAEYVDVLLHVVREEGDRLAGDAFRRGGARPAPRRRRASGLSA